MTRVGKHLKFVIVIGLVSLFAVSHIAYAQAPGDVGTSPGGGTPGTSLEEGTVGNVKQPVVLSVPIPTPNAEEPYLTKVEGRIDGKDVGIFYQYIGVMFQWVAGVIGVIAILMIIISGFMMIFASGNQQLVDDAKQRIFSAVYGLILLILTALLLWVINPGFFGGISIYRGKPPEALGYPQTVPFVPKETTYTDEEKEKLPKVPGSFECDTTIAQGPAQQVMQLVNSGKIALYGGSSSIPGSGPYENVQDILNGKCPVTERQYVNPATNNCDGNASGTGVREPSPAENTAPFLSNAASKSLPGLVAIGNAFTKVDVSALYGGNHSCSEHRQLRAIDINYLDDGQGRVHIGPNVGVDRLCAMATKLLSASGAKKVIGPTIINGKCGGNVKGNAVHDSHFHLSW